MRVVRVSTATVAQCNACGGEHKSIALYDAISGPGIDVPEGATKAIVCPDQDYTVVLIDRGHIDDSEESDET